MSLMNPTSSLFFAAVLAATLSLPVPAQDIVAVKAGKLITISGTPLTDAVVLIENGKIKAIGTAKEVEVPWDAKVIDASKQVVMPTYVIAHTSGGMTSGNEQMANVPYLTVQDAVDPANRYFEEALRNGVGTIHVIPGNRTLIGGSGMVVKPYGKTVEDMAVLSKTGLKMSLGSAGSRMAQIQQMRRALEDIKQYMADYERRKKEFEQEKAAGATKKEKFEEKIDEKKQPVVDLLEGKATAWFYVPSTAELYEAVRLINQYKLKVVLVLGARCHKAAKYLKGLGSLKSPIVLDATMEYFEKDPDTEKEEKHCPAASFSKAGVTFAMSLSTSTSNSDMNRYPWWQMATAIRNGVSREEALKSLTIVPAKILGLDDQVGTLEVGKRANLQILTGDPLQATSWVEKVLLDGEVVYDRSTDARLQYLFGKSEENDKAKKQGSK